MPIITQVQAREVLDSRGNPTVEVEVLTEAVHLVAQSFHQVHQQVNMKQLNYVMATSRYLGKGVLKAVENVNEHNCRRIRRRLFCS